MAYLECMRTKKKIDIKSDSLVIDIEWIELALGYKPKGVVKNHAKIEKEDDSYFLKALSGRTIYSGLEIPLGDRVKLEHYGAIAIGDMVKGAGFVFNDQSQQQRWNDTRKLKMHTMSPDRIRNIAEKLSKEYFEEMPSSLSEFADKTMLFFKEKFKVDRGALYKIVGTKWKPLSAMAPRGESYRPPRKILNDLWKDRQPISFCPKNISKTEYDLSKSIVEDNVMSAIAVPLLRKEKLIGALYIDKVEGSAKLDNRCMAILCSMLPGITASLHLLIEKDKEAVQAHQLLQLLCKSVPLKDVEFHLFNHSLDSISISKKGFSDSDFIFAHLFFKAKPGKEITTAEKIAACSAVVCVIETSRIDEDKEFKLYSRLVTFLEGKFTNLDIQIGMCYVKGNVLSFSGFGRDVNVVIKPPNRNAHLHANDVDALNISGGKLPEVVQFDLYPGSKLMLSHEVPEEICEILDETPSFEEITTKLSKMRCGGVFVQLPKKSNQEFDMFEDEEEIGGFDDEIDEIEL